MYTKKLLRLVSAAAVSVGCCSSQFDGDKNTKLDGMCDCNRLQVVSHVCDYFFLPGMVFVLPLRVREFVLVR